MAEEPQHPIQVKAKGKKLITKSRRLLDNIPAEFKTQAVTRLEQQPVPTETPIDSTFAAGQVGSSVVLDNTTQSKKVDEFLENPTPIVLTEYTITPEGQLGTRTRTLDDSLQTLTPDPLQVDGDVKNLGGNWTIQEKVVVEEVFDNALFQKERAQDVIPARFRALYPTTTTRLDSAGTAAMPTLGAGEQSKSSEQVREGVKRDTLVSRDTSSGTSLASSLTTSEFAGTVAVVTESIVAAGTASDSGENIISSEVEALGDGTGLKRTVARNASESAWQEVTEYEADARSETVFEIKKKVVPASSVTPPTVSGLVATEYKSLDRWRSIRIITTMPSSILSTTIVRNIARRSSFPYEVTRCLYVAAFKRTNFTVPGSGTIANEVSSFDIALDIAYRGGYSGPVEAQMTETFTTNPSATLPTIFKYYTIGGTICLGYTMSGVTLSGANVRMFTIKDSLHAALNPTPPAITNFASGAVITGTLTYSAVTWAPSTGIPASTPTTLNGGSFIIEDVAIEKWRNGVYVKSVLEVKVPTFP